MEKIDSLVRDDSSVERVEEDKLGYAPFSKSIAMTVTNESFPRGYVIGIRGEWGAGKTTTINFVKHYIEEYNQTYATKDPVRIVDFNPWLVRNHDELASQYFRVLREQIKDSNRKQRLLTKVFRLAGFLNDNSKALTDALTAMAAVTSPSAAVASKLIGEIAGGWLSKLVKREGETPSIQKAYEKLKSELLESPRKIVVFIDDIDRLNREEIKTMFQLVKSVGALPGVIYILSFDQQVVEKALDEDSSCAMRTRSRYLEKIIQEELDLPQPEIHGLQKLLTDELNFLSSEVFRSHRWVKLWKNGLRKWIQKPRDIYRFRNSLMFMFKSVGDEVDTVDICSMVGLQMFEPNLYRYICNNRGVLVGNELSLIFQETVQAKCAEIKMAIPDIGTRNIIEMIFPKAAQIINGNNLGQELDISVISRRGVGSPQGYDTFMRAGLPKNEIPLSTIEHVMQSLDDMDALNEVTEDWLQRRDVFGQTLFLNLANEIGARLQAHQHRNIRPTKALIAAFMRATASLFYENDSDAFFGVLHQARLRIERWLYDFETVELAEEAFAQGFEQISDYAVGAYWYYHATSVSDQKGIIESLTASPTVSGRVERHVRNLLQHRTIFPCPRLLTVADVIFKLEGHDAARQWVLAVAISGREGLLKVLEALQGKTAIDGGALNWAQPGKAQSFFDLEALRNIAVSLQSEMHQYDGADAINVFLNSRRV